MTNLPEGRCHCAKPRPRVWRGVTRCGFCLRVVTGETRVKIDTDSQPMTGTSKHRTVRAEAFYAERERKRQKRKNAKRNRR